jgi:hypothetical protein
MGTGKNFGGMTGRSVAGGGPGCGRWHSLHFSQAPKPARQFPHASH